MSTRYTFTLVFAGARTMSPATMDALTNPTLRTLGAVNVQPSVVVATATVPVGQLRSLPCGEAGDEGRGFVLPSSMPWFDPTPRPTVAGGVEVPINCGIPTELSGATLTLTMLERTFDADLPPLPWSNTLCASVGISTSSSGRAGAMSECARFNTAAGGPRVAAQHALYAGVRDGLPGSYQLIYPYPGRASALAAPRSGGVWPLLLLVAGAGYAYMQSGGGLRGLGAFGRTNAFTKASRLRKLAQRYRHEGRYGKARALERRANQISRSA